MKGIFDKCYNVFTTHKLGVDLLAIIFGIGSWIGVNGVFMQLPLMVGTHPESWNLPSYVTIITQSGNIGLIIYAFMRKYCRQIKDSWIIYFIQGASCICVILLYFFHQSTSYINGNKYSIPLFVLLFFLAISGCSSSVLFIPFMNHFKHMYLISYFIGDGLSPLIPSVVALIQGVRDNTSCSSTTNNTNNTNNVNVSADVIQNEPAFSIETYFVFILFMLILSNIAFILLNNLDYCRSEKLNAVERKFSSEHLREDRNESMQVEESDHIDKSNEKSIISAYKCKNTYFYYLILLSCICFLLYGFFPGIMSYSCLPYGNSVYHLALTITNIANPLACCFAFIFPNSSFHTITGLAALTSIPAGYNIATALLSPTPPLLNTTAGDIFVVSSWVAFTGFASYLRVTIASSFHSENSGGLFWYGVAQQVGSAIGSLLSFILVNYSSSFVSYDPCR